MFYYHIVHFHIVHFHSCVIFKSLVLPFFILSEQREVSGISAVEFRILRHLSLCFFRFLSLYWAVSIYPLVLLFVLLRYMSFYATFIHFMLFPCVLLPSVAFYILTYLFIVFYFNISPSISFYIPTW